MRRLWMFWLADLAGDTERSREKSSRATRGYRMMTGKLPLAATRRNKTMKDFFDGRMEARNAEKRRLRGCLFSQSVDDKVPQRRNQGLRSIAHAV